MIVKVIHGVISASNVNQIQEKYIDLYSEGVNFMEKELKEAQELIKKLYKLLGSSADVDFRLWKETEKYCKEKKLITK
jgi:hypothetical protein